MEEKETFAAPAAENAEPAAEKSPRLFTQDEVNEIVGKVKARTRAKAEKELRQRLTSEPRTDADREAIQTDARAPEEGTYTRSEGETGRFDAAQSLEAGDPLLENPEFMNFAGKFHADTPAQEVLHLYRKLQPEKKYMNMGSMKHTAGDRGGVKEFYSFEEASRFTKQDFDRSPALYKAVRESMTKW